MKKAADITSLISPIYFGDKYNVSPHCLMELSIVDWQRMKDNCIHLSGIKMITIEGRTEVYYSKIEYGKHVTVMKRKSISNDKSIKLKEVNISTKKVNYFIITTEKTAVLRDKLNLIIDATHQAENHQSSGKIFLCVCIYNHQKDRIGWTWGKDHYTAIDNSKPNMLIGDSKNFESTGKYYSYGNKGAFGMVDNTSVSQYVMKIPQLKHN